jgi:hypothetical protein
MPHLTRVGALLLIGAGGAQADPPLSPLPAPKYSFDLTSPAAVAGTVGSADILTVSFPNPIAAHPGEQLQLFSGDDIDALSAPNRGVSGDVLFSLLFSVDRQSTGLAEPSESLVMQGVPFNVHDQADRGHAAGDQFLSTARFTRFEQVNPGGDELRNNVMTRNNFDEGGEDFAAYPATHGDTQLAEVVVQDNVDATARLDDGEAVPEMFFSLSVQSPSLALLSMPGMASGANIFYTAPGGEPTGTCCAAAGGCITVTEGECTTVTGVWLGPGVSCAACNVMEQGACCLPSDECAVMDDLACLEADGLWLGPQAICNHCESGLPAGACCLPDQTCAIVDDFDCMMSGGLWMGPDAPCEFCEDTIRIGACCHANMCSLGTGFECESLGGLWLGPETTCNDCAVASGACCQLDGSCSVLDMFTCLDEGGIPHGPNAPCELCDIEFFQGACCLGAACEVLSEWDCFNSGGAWLGPNIDCELCQELLVDGACCDPTTGACSITDISQCFGGGGTMGGGIWLGPDTDCSLCDNGLPLGPCCLSNGGCDTLDDATCDMMGGTPLGPQADCGFCSGGLLDVGSCCLGDMCTETNGPDCDESGGLWLGPAAHCDLCAEIFLPGACCLEDGCQLLDEFECVLEGGVWSGPQSKCGVCGSCTAADGTCQPATTAGCNRKTDVFVAQSTCAPTARRSVAGAGAITVSVYAHYTDLGLQAADNIDALIVFDDGEVGQFDQGDVVLFSLAAGSPSLTTLPAPGSTGPAASVFRVTIGATPTVFASADALGLGAPQDELDALDLHINAGGPSPALPITLHGIRGPVPTKQLAPRQRRLRDRGDG